jgi:hypothetical protein
MSRFNSLQRVGSCSAIALRVMFPGYTRAGMQNLHANA